MTTTNSDNSVLCAGAAAVDITPQMGIQIAGDIARRRPVEEIREPIHARALVVESGGKRLCIVSTELLAIMDIWVHEIRRRAHEQFGLDPECIMVHTVQNHASPVVGHHMISDSYTDLPDDLWWIRGGDERYNEPAVQGILEAIGKAIKALEPVTVHAGRTVDGRVAFNRRFIMRDGTVKTHPKSEDLSNILQCEGPVDPEVGVMLFKGQDGRNVASLLHHTCHPVHGYPFHYIIAGWPGAWVAATREAFGDDCVSLVINGFVGNIHHTNHLDPDYVSDYVRMGKLLAESAIKVTEQMEVQECGVLDNRTAHIRLPLRELSDEQVAKARKFLAEHPEPLWLDEEKTSINWEWVYAHAVLDLVANRKRQAYYDMEIQVLRIADSAIVGVPGEPFVEGQLKIKAASPAPYTFAAHMTNGFAGYIPTPEAIERGGYETITANWSKLAPEALDTITESSVGLLKELF